MLLARFDEAQLEKQQHPAERNTDRRKQDVKGDVGRKLDAGKQKCVEVFHIFNLGVVY